MKNRERHVWAFLLAFVGVILVMRCIDLENRIQLLADDNSTAHYKLAWVAEQLPPVAAHLDYDGEMLR